MTTFAIVGLDKDENLGLRELRSYLEERGPYKVKQFSSYGHRGGNIVAILDWIRSVGYNNESVVVSATTFNGFLSKDGTTIQNAPKVFQIVDNLVNRTSFLGCFLVAGNYWSNNNSDRKTKGGTGVLKESTDPRTAMASKLWVIGLRAIRKIREMNVDDYKALRTMLYGRETLEDLTFAAFLQVYVDLSVVLRDNNYVCLPMSDSWKDSNMRASDLRAVIKNCPIELRGKFKSRMWTYLRSDKHLCDVLGKGHHGRFNSGR